MTASVVNIHLVPFLTDIGIDPVEATSKMGAFYVGTSIPFRFIGGFIADHIRIHQFRLLNGGAYPVRALGVAIFLLNQNMTTIYVWLALQGIGQGVLYTANPLIMARHFGRKAYGSVRGTATLFITPGSAAAPIYVGWTYDTPGSYILAFTLMAILLTIGGVVACCILPPKPPAVSTDQ